jgi:hypothetical protein
MDRERICHSKSVFKGPETRRSDFPVTGFGKPFPCSGDQRTQEASEIGGSEVAGLPERKHFAQAKDVQTHCPTQRTVLPGSIAKRALGRSTANEPKGGRLTKSERCARSTRSRRTCGAPNHGLLPPEAYQTPGCENAPRYPRSRFLPRAILKGARCGELPSLHATIPQG